MDDQPENVRKKFDVNKHLIDKTWENKEKGLRKEVINFQYCSVVKASELSKCLVDILEVQNLNEEKHKTNYLSEDRIGKEFWIEIGHSLTPIDCYVEEFLKQMFMNETSRCQITTKSSGAITFTMRLKQIEFGGFFCEQRPEKMFELAKCYKENGVKMFKNYPLFAHQYFSLAAKCLISLNDDIEGSLSESDLTQKDFDDMLQNVYLNIAACLIKQQRYDDILHVLKYTSNQEAPSEKAVYRLALAHFNLKQFQDAKDTIEKIDYKGNKELVQLMAKIQEFWKVDHDKYSNMVKKMFK